MRRQSCATITGTTSYVPDVKPAVPSVGAVAAVAFDPATRRMAVGSYKSVHIMTLADRTWSRTLAGHARPPDEREDQLAA